MTISASIILPALAVGSTGNSFYASAVELPFFTATGTMDETPAVTLPIFTLEAEILAGTINRESTIDLPALTATGTLISDCFLDAAVTLPKLSLSAQLQGPSEFILPALQLAGAATSGNIASSALQLPALTLSATLETQQISTGVVTLPMLQVSASCAAGNYAAAAVSLKRLALAAEGYTGQVSTAEVTLPMFEISASGHGEYVGTATLELPALTLQATLSGPAPTNSTAFVMNVKTAALTQYDWAFNSFTEFNGVQLAASSTGIYAIGGDLDQTAFINASARMGVTDFGSGQMKRCDMAYVGYRSDGELLLKVTTDEGTEYEYPLEPRKDDLIHGNRVKLGKGLRGRYWQFAVENLEGSDFEFDNLQVSAHALKRKI